jgi:hypothetical protein
VFFCFFFARPSCGETTFEDITENLHHDGLGGSGRRKDLAEIPGDYLLPWCIVKTRRYDLLQV